MQKVNLIFDLDGTLIDVSHRHYHVYHKIISNFKGNPLPKVEYWDLKRNKTPTSSLLSKSSLPEELTQKYNEEFLMIIEDPQLLELDKIYEYTLSTLDQLSQFCDLYLITFRQFEDQTKEQITKLNLSTKFKDIKIGRPKITGLESKMVMIKHLNLQPKTFIIGDTEDEILSAKNLSFLSIAVTSGIRRKSKLEIYQPDYLVENISEVVAIVQQKLY